MLRVGYGMLMLAGAGLVGYLGYHLARILWQTHAIPVFVKALILLAGAGIVVTLIGLIWERRREERSASDDNGDD